MNDTIGTLIPRILVISEKSIARETINRLLSSLESEEPDLSITAHYRSARSYDLAIELLKSYLGSEKEFDLIFVDLAIDELKGKPQEHVETQCNALNKVSGKGYLIFVTTGDHQEPDIQEAASYLRKTFLGPQFAMRGTLSSVDDDTLSDRQKKERIELSHRIARVTSLHSQPESDVVTSLALRFDALSERLDSFQNLKDEIQTFKAEHQQFLSSAKLVLQQVKSDSARAVEISKDESAQLKSTSELQQKYLLGEINEVRETAAEVSKKLDALRINFQKLIGHIKLIDDRITPIPSMGRKLTEVSNQVDKVKALEPQITQSLNDIEPYRKVIRFIMKNKALSASGGIGVATAIAAEVFVRMREILGV